MDMVAMIGAGAAVITLIFGLIKFLTSQVESKLSSRDVEQEKRLDSQAADIEELKTKLAETRTELHRDYVHKGQLAEFQQKLERDLENIFKRLEGVSRDLNQLLGRLDHVDKETP